MDVPCLPWSPDTGRQVYYESYTVIQAVRYTTYCYFSTCSPLTSPQQQLWPFVIKRWTPMVLGALYVIFKQALQWRTLQCPCNHSTGQISDNRHLIIRSC